MRPVSIASDLPTYADAATLRLPSYADQWRQSPLTRPAQAHVTAGDAFDAAPQVESGQMAPQAPMQALRINSAPPRQRLLQAISRGTDNCVSGCVGCCSASAMICGVITAGGVMVVVGYLQGASTTGGIGGGLVALGLICGIVYSQQGRHP